MPPTTYLQFEVWKLLFEIWSLEFEVEPWNVKLEIRNPSFEAGSLKVETWNLKVEATLPSQILKTSENLWKSLKIFEDDVSMSYDSETISQWDMIFKGFSKIFQDFQIFVEIEMGYFASSYTPPPLPPFLASFP